MKSPVVLFIKLLGPTSSYSDLISLNYSLGTGILLSLFNGSHVQVKVENHHLTGWAAQHLTQKSTGSQVRSLGQQVDMTYTKVWELVQSRNICSSICLRCLNNPHKGELMTQQCSLFNSFMVKKLFFIKTNC